MFTELLPFLTFAFLDIKVVGEGNQITVTVIPLSKDEKSKTSLVPLTIRGTAEELDAKLPEILTKYRDSHLDMHKSLEAAQQAMKAIAEEANRKLAEQKKAKPAAGAAAAPGKKGDRAAPPPSSKAPGPLFQPDGQTPADEKPAAPADDTHPAPGDDEPAATETSTPTAAAA